MSGVMPIEEMREQLAQLEYDRSDLKTFKEVLMEGCIGYDNMSENRIRKLYYKEFAREYPSVAYVNKVGSYAPVQKCGAGYFYDEVLEYRVWVHGIGGPRFEAFAKLEDALEFSLGRGDTEPPLALVFQKEWIDEPVKGEFIAKKGKRITEWSIEWLDDNHKRKPDSIEKFLKSKRG